MIVFQAIDSRFRHGTFGVSQAYGPLDHGRELHSQLPAGDVSRWGRTPPTAPAADVDRMTGSLARAGLRRLLTATVLGVELILQQPSAAVAVKRGDGILVFLADSFDTRTCEVRNNSWISHDAIC